jgi:hypothetical protein
LVGGERKLAIGATIGNGQGCVQQDGDAAGGFVFAQLQTDLNSINAGQQQVEDDQVRLFSPRKTQTCVSIGSHQHAKSLAPQDTLEFFEGFGVLIH